MTKLTITKIRFFIISLILLGTTGTQAQVMGFREPLVHMSVKAGGGLSVLASAPVKSAVGPLAGLTISRNLGRAGVRLELLGSMFSYTTKFPASYYSLYSPGMDTVSKGEFQAIYGSAPLLVEYQFREKIQLLFGPQVSYLVTLTDKNNAFTKIYGEDKFLKKIDVSVVAGAEYTITKKLKAGARLVIGVTDVNNSIYYLVPRSWTTFGAQIALSYKIL